MVMFELHNTKKHCLGAGVAPQAPIPLYPIGQHRCFWISMMLVFELHNAQKHCLGSVVAPQTPIPLYPIGQQRCFWIPMMVMFELHNAQKKLCGFWGGASNTHTSVPHGLANVFLDTYDV